MKVNQSFINFLSTDIIKTRNFYESLGLETAKEFSSDEVHTVKLTLDSYIIFVKKELLEKLVPAKIKNPVYNQNIFSMMLSSQSEVEYMKHKLSSLKINYKEVEEAYMYYLQFQDPNGYFVEIGYFKNA
ncbi:VOC family protein [Acholeplasma hippikon]|nr:hypothetical protein [Acholeplasma hippikon]